MDSRQGPGHKIIEWLEGPYENSLYAAVSEFYKTERWGYACAAWQANFNLIVGLRLHWVPKVRQRLNVIHREKGAKFGRAVQISADPREPDDARLHLRPWTIVWLNVDGKEIGSYSGKDVTRLSTKDSGKLRDWFRIWRIAAKFIIKDHNDRVVRTVNLDDVLPNVTH